MAWKYHQKTGVITLFDYVVYRHGYSGKGYGRNNPAAESLHALGPIPQGWYHIGKPHDSHLGKPTLNLSPEGHNAHGRTLFRIHGDNKNHNYSASEGCIILPLDVRQRIAHSGFHRLHVVA